MKALLIFILFCLNINLQAQDFFTISSAEVRKILLSNEIAGKHYVLDSKYKLPNKEWIYNDFYEKYVKWIGKQVPILKIKNKRKYNYIINVADCDNRGFWLSVYATFWNLNHQSDNVSIFIAPVSYQRKYDKKYHVINLFIDNTRHLYFIAPGTGTEIILDKKEKQSVHFLISL